MGKEDRTLTFSEQKAHDGVLKLVRLGMVPNYSWCAVNMGRVENAGYDQGFGGNWKIKMRQVAFEWKHGLSGKIILEMILRAEIPLDSTAVGEVEIQSEKAQRRWWIVGIEIFWLNEDGGRHPGFKLEGESNVDILFNKLESDFFKS